MLKAKRQTKILIAIACVAAILLVSLLSLYFTGAWFFARRNAEGVLNFAQGIKINYSGVYVVEEAGTVDFNFRAKIDDGEFEELDEGNSLAVGSSTVLTLDNPTFSLASTSVNCYIRVQMTTELYFNIGMTKTLLTDANLSTFLAQFPTAPTGITTVEDVKENIFEFFPELASTWKKIGDWFYYCGTGTTPLTVAYSSTNNPTIELLQKELDNTVKLALDDSIDFGSTLPFSQVKLGLVFEAGEASANTLERWEIAD